MKNYNIQPEVPNSKFSTSSEWLPTQYGGKVNNAEIAKLAETKEPSFESIDTLISLHEVEKEPSVKKVIEDFLDTYENELRKGDTWLSQHMEGFLSGTLASRQNPESEFISNWFTLKVGEKEFGKKFADSNKLMEILGYKESGIVERHGDRTFIGMTSDLFPSLEIVRQESERGKQISYVVSQRAKHTIAA